MKALHVSKRVDELADYRAALTGIDASLRPLIELQLLPKQVQSHHAISELKKLLH
jgi:hypothetical protein